MCALESADAHRRRGPPDQFGARFASAAPPPCTPPAQTRSASKRCGAGRWSSDCWRIYVRACFEQALDWWRRAGSQRVHDVASTRRGRGTVRHVAKWISHSAAMARCCRCCAAMARCCRCCRGGGGRWLQQKSSTGPSRVVPHRSTTPARSSLTSLFGWEAVSLDDMAALLALAHHMIL